MVGVGQAIFRFLRFKGSSNAILESISTKANLELYEPVARGPPRLLRRTTTTKTTRVGVVHLGRSTCHAISGPLSNDDHKSSMHTFICPDHDSDAFSD